ncbi:hypothetical protein BDV96DRAFT_585721 [Lophiotrema nucula]|uniref:Uncharacterized protein n=1 Tax=Lophiotrema nucula TaxID=690887 RepID=A0A6A5YQV0_9PLEO|nr:hypothetical protein BDV96DRAFT_585721 [Lophiotrema nucula]
MRSSVSRSERYCWSIKLLIFIVHSADLAIPHQLYLRAIGQNSDPRLASALSTGSNGYDCKSSTSHQVLLSAGSYSRFYNSRLRSWSRSRVF